MQGFGLSYFLTSATGCSPPKRLTKKPPAHLVIHQVQLDVSNKEAKQKTQKWFNRPFSDPPNPRKGSHNVAAGETKNTVSHAHSRTMPASAWAGVTAPALLPYYPGTRGRSNTTSQAEQETKYIPAPNPEQHLHWYRAAEIVVGVHPAVYASSLPRNTSPGHRRNPGAAPLIHQVGRGTLQIARPEREFIDSNAETEELLHKIKLQRISRQNGPQHPVNLHTFGLEPDTNATPNVTSGTNRRRRPAPILALKDATNASELSQPDAHGIGRLKSSTRTNRYPKGKENRPIMPVY